LSKKVFNLRFRTRLALVMFITMASSSAILTWTHFQHRHQIMEYVSAETSYLMSISQLTQKQLPTSTDPNVTLKAYKKAMEDAGFSSVNLLNPTGEVVASSNPKQVGKRIPIKKRPLPENHDRVAISAALKDLDPGTPGEAKRLIKFPIVQGDKVIGYAIVEWEADEVEALMRRWYKERLYWILATMTVALGAVVYLAFVFTKPLDKLVHGAEQVAMGNLYVSLPDNRSDEMGRLAQTFNHMVERLREHRQLQERLNEAEKLSLLGRFAATVAHEVRNSLNFINLSIDQIRAKHARGDDRAARDVQRNLGNIKEEILRLNHLVNDFLAAGRQAPPDKVPCDLKATLEQAGALVEKQARRQEITIQSDLPVEMPIFLADAGQMKTCFMNILTNAIQAMPRGGRIQITAGPARNGDGAGVFEFRFADTGPGIPLEDRERVFAPFYSTKATGFGLGLAITKKIVEDHGGRVYVTDGNAPGTAMVLELPLPQPAISEPAPITTSQIA
jgi:signal transduction histidine kinase